MIYIVNRAFNKNNKLFRKDQKIEEKLYNSLDESKIFVKRISENENDSKILKGLAPEKKGEESKEDESLEDLRSEYKELSGKDVSNKYSNNKEWLESKIEELKKEEESK